jgi:hypothetical protein
VTTATLPAAPTVTGWLPTDAELVAARDGAVTMLAAFYNLAADICTVRADYFGGALTEPAYRQAMGRLTANDRVMAQRDHLHRADVSLDLLTPLGPMEEVTDPDKLRAHAARLRVLAGRLTQLAASRGDRDMADRIGRRRKELRHAAQMARSAAVSAETAELRLRAERLHYTAEGADKLAALAAAAATAAARRDALDAEVSRLSLTPAVAL